MTEFERIKYEDLYRAKWLEQNVKDEAANPRWNGGMSNSARNGFKKHPSVNKGGRPKLTLSKDAVMLNKLLQRELSLTDAADIMGLTVKSLRQIKSRYGLPRSKHEKPSDVHSNAD